MNYPQAFIIVVIILYFDGAYALLTLNDWKTSPHLTGITDKQWELLSNLENKLLEWNPKVNLISRKDIDMLVPSHIIPSLAVTRVRRFATGERVIDVGTGGGFPGLPLAIVCPDAHFTLLDSNGKKMTVVRDIAESLKLPNVKVINARAESVPDTFDFMLGRAVSRIPNFLSFSSHLISEASMASTSSVPNFNKEVRSGLLYIKGGEYADELVEANIHESFSLPIKSLLGDTLETDKNILFIPAHEIVKFRREFLIKQEEEAARLQAAKAGKGKGGATASAAKPTSRPKKP